MSNRYLTINGGTYNPTTFEYNPAKIGEERRMANGALRFYYRATKGKWTLSWTKLRESNAQIAALTALAEGSSSFTFVDYNNVSHTVTILPGNFTLSLSADSIGATGIKFYDMSVTLDEA